MPDLHAALRAAAAITLFTLVACGSQKQGGTGSGAPEVGVITVASSEAVITTLLPGRTVAFRVAQVRPQVSGIIKQRLYTEGAQVSAGQALYQLDPAPYQAALDSAQAAVGKADANALTARLKYERYIKLAQSGDVSQQERDDATANLRQAEADQATARAALEVARINLGYTRISAPIAGRTATSAFTEGALVTANQDAPLTMVQQYDPMYVDLAQPAADVLRLREQFAAGGLRHADAHSATVRLLLEGNARYAREGRLEFTGISVSEDTGAIRLRAVFPNPEGTLLPGMYVRAELVEAIAEKALLVPQQAVSRDPRGNAVALVVGAGDKVESRTLEVAPADGNQWRVRKGLAAGERVIVQGAMNARPGSTVKPVPAQLPGAG
jgi:membrane fusion protein (multidrug efflux system)